MDLSIPIENFAYCTEQPAVVTLRGLFHISARAECHARNVLGEHRMYLVLVGKRSVGAESRPGGRESQ